MRGRLRTVDDRRRPRAAPALGMLPPPTSCHVAFRVANLHVVVESARSRSTFQVFEILHVVKARESTPSDCFSQSGRQTDLNHLMVRFLD